MKLGNKEKEIIGLALDEYEESHWADYGKVWQNRINKLMKEFPIK